MADASSIAGYIKVYLEESFYYSNNIYYNSGNVGIGTATVSYPLHVQGQIYSSSQYILSSSIDSGLWFGNGDAALGRANGAGSYSSSAVAGDIILRSATANKLLLQSGGGASAIAITSTGNVGIGTATIQSSYKLQVQGNAWVENQLVFNNSYRGGGGDFPCNKILLYGGGNVPTNTSAGEVFGFGVAANGKLEYFASNTHAFYTGTTGGTNYGTERMVITSTGNVGIGTNNPTTAKLVISGTSGATGLDMATNDQYAEMRIIRNSISSLDKNLYFGFLAGAGSQVILYSNNTETLRCNNGAVTTPSDSRIKKDIEDINDETALNKLLLIQPTTYNYIDVERNKGFGKVYGFIAQQIREVIPEAVPIIETITPIPNIYKSCLINNKREVYHSIPLDTPFDTDIKIKEAMYKIKEIYEDYFVIDKDIEDVEAFVYGYTINDFHTLDKTYIFTLNVCATQELHRRIEAQSVLLKSQDDRIRDLESKVATLMSM